MNILCIDQFTSVGGGQNCLLDLLPAFLNRGWSVHVALPGEGAYQDRLRRSGIQTHCLLAGSYTSIKKPVREMFNYAVKLPEHVHKLIRICRRQQIDLLYINGPRFLPAAVCAARLLSLKTVFHCHHRITQRIAIRLAGEALRLSRTPVIACCQYAAEPLRGYIEHDRLHILFNGVSGAPLRQSRLCRGRRRIGVIGRIESEKGQLDFVNAARVVQSHFSNCEFVIVGSPLFSSVDYLQKVIQASHGLSVDFTGWQDDIASVLQSLDLLVVPSRCDATPRVILEAFAAGVPVVAFAAGGIPEIIEDGQTGFLVNEMSPAALARCIENVLEASPDNLSALVARARMCWERDFNLTLFQERVCTALADSFWSDSPDRSGASIPQVERQSEPFAPRGQA